MDSVIHCELSRKQTRNGKEGRDLHRTPLWKLFS
jgi:hypothetical protein